MLVPFPPVAGGRLAEKLVDLMILCYPREAHVRTAYRRNTQHASSVDTGEFRQHFQPITSRRRALYTNVVARGTSTPGKPRSFTYFIHCYTCCRGETDLLHKVRVVIKHLAMAHRAAILLFVSCTARASLADDVVAGRQLPRALRGVAPCAAITSKLSGLEGL